MLRLATALSGVVLLLAACGEDDDSDGSAAAPAPAAFAADLTVIVSPEGPGGPANERRIECDRLGPSADPPVCRRITPGQFAPVPGQMACTAIYGGPGVARVRGTLRGEPVDARFSLEDGCQIARWERNRELLGTPHRGP